MIDNSPDIANISGERIFTKGEQYADTYRYTDNRDRKTNT